MDRTTAIKQFNALADAINAAYLTIMAVLAALPVPMLMPAPDSTGDKSLSLSRAWEMAAEEPLLPMTISQVRAMICAYFQAWEVAYVATLKGPADWRLRAIEDSLARIDEAEKVIMRHLAGDFRAERLTDEAVADIARLYGNHTREKR
jgi:hypothetical protein